MSEFGDDDNPLEWSADEEGILKVISEKCFLMSEYHKKKYLKLQNKLKYYKIPVIIISGINSVIAVGMSEYLPQNVISATNCILALICGIIGSIELYLKLSDNMNREFMCGRDFYLLHIDIKKTLALRHNNRRVAGSVYLNTIYTKYIKTVSGAQVMIGDSLIHNFDEYFSKEAAKSIERRKSIMMDKLTIEKLRKESEKLSKYKINSNANSNVKSNIKSNDVEIEMAPLLEDPNEKDIEDILDAEKVTESNNKIDDKDLDTIT